MIIFRPPRFNTTFAIWYRALPASLEGWRALRPTRSPDVQGHCQLYYPRYGVGRWLHSLSSSVQDTLLKSGFQELRCPRGTVIQCPWIVTPGDNWSLVPLAEVPRGSGRLYAVVMVDIAHIGFPNEYVVALLSQLGSVGSGGPMASGSAMTAGLSPPGMAFRLASGAAMTAEVNPQSAWARLASGSALGSTWSPPMAGAAELPSGSALASTWSPPITGAAELPSGSALLATFSPPVTGAAKLTSGSALTGKSKPPGDSADLATGSALTGKLKPPGDSADLASGSALTATVSSGGGSVTPGTTCAGAVAITLPFSQSFTINPGESHWFKFTAGSGVYHERVTGSVNVNTAGQVGTGSCPLPSFVGNLNNISTCVDHTPGGGTVVFINFAGYLGGAYTYTLEVGTGAC